MLTKFHKILIAVLAVQIALAVVVLVRGDDAAELASHPILARFDAAKVTRLQVWGPDAKAPIDLQKVNGTWIVASSFDYPADASKLDAVLAPIAKMSADAPIATSKSRHAQLKVAADQFERKLVITMDGKDTTLYLGGSAGLRRTAVRLGGDDRVYAATGVSAWTAGTTAVAWIDPEYVKIPRDDIAKVTIERPGFAGPRSTPGGSAEAIERPGFAGPRSTPGGSAEAIERPGSKLELAAGQDAKDPWTVAIDGAPVTLASGETLDTAAISHLVDAVATIEMTAPGDPKHDASQPAAIVTIERRPAKSTPAPTVLEIVADGTSYWVHQRGAPTAALVDKDKLDDVVAVDRAKLVKAPPPAPAKPAVDAKATPKTPPAAAAARPKPGAPGAQVRSHN